MSLLNAGPKRSSQPVFPYAVIPEKKSFLARNRRRLILAGSVALGMAVMCIAVVLVA